MSAVNFTRAPTDRVRITLSPRRRNYRAMSTASAASASLHPLAVADPRTPATPPTRTGLSSVLFDRVSPAWWDPRFDSEILEGQLRSTAFTHVRRKFGVALIYGSLVATAWGIFAGVKGIPAGAVVGASAAVWLILTTLVTRCRVYREMPGVVGGISAAVLYAASCSAVTVSPLAQSGVFSLSVSVLLVIYAAFPLPLYVCFTSGVIYSILFELTTAFSVSDYTGIGVPVRLVLHLGVHLVGVHLMVMTQVRLHSTFLKVGQSALVRRDLEVEKALKEKMIASVMPPKVAKWLLTTEGPGDGDGEEEEEEAAEDGRGSAGKGARKLSSPRGSSSASGVAQPQPTSGFRPFNMNKMDEVSILFADMVGFTRMSSNKTAEQLVGLLNDLFGRFDALCTRLGCEKISTLGDCYYCVSGCPEPKADHAHCCVKMGLAMIDAVRRFGDDHATDDEDDDGSSRVNMRVGVHTGTVLCGVVGTRRFKFDVFSNDVTKANRMESTGRAGRVHVSQATYDYLKDDYYVEEGDLYEDMKTYFIIGAKNVVDGLGDQRSAWRCQESLPVDTVPCAQQSEDVSIEVEGPPPIIVNEEHETFSSANENQLPKKASLTQSWSTLNSRKDSGIRSRRSSIQAQLLESGGLATTDFIMIGDDYYTSSQYSVGEDGTVVKDSELKNYPDNISEENYDAQRHHHRSFSSESYFDPNVPLNESLRFHLLRKQSDLQMIKCIQRNSTHADYFMRPPIHPLTLFFTEPDEESEYRQRAYKEEESFGVGVTNPGSRQTLASPTFNTYFDVMVAVLVYFAVSVSCFILFTPSPVWMFVFCASTCWLMFIVTLCVRRFLADRLGSSCFHRMFDACTHWYSWHVCVAVLISLPVVAIGSNFSCEVWMDDTTSSLYCCTFFVALVHFCNFTQLNCWMKSGLATIASGVLIVLLLVEVCPRENLDLFEVNQTLNATNEGGSSSMSSEWMLNDEAAMAVVLLLLLVWYVNREFEISYRMSFHGNLLAERDQQTIQSEKDQAEWHLHNIIPRHVAEHIKTTSKYSENHENVGVLFASIVNFNEMYDESYRGGCECLRVLNEVIGDFDELLHRPEFRNVEKIKTIGTTYMAASGLNPKVRRGNVHQHQHLFELMDFAFALQRVIDAFNADLLSFGFIIRIGYNFGDVTAGVIGTTKLYYDIWSDAVNIASRMDSTGIPGRIQVPEHCVPVLEEVFDLERRGTIYVKGKDNMVVYLVVGKKEGVEYRPPRAMSDVSVVSQAPPNLPHLSMLPEQLT